MSTKTLRKRIALVAVSAMGFGLLSTTTANAALGAGGTPAAGNYLIAGTAGVNGVCAVSTTVSSQYIVVNKNVASSVVLNAQAAADTIAATLTAKLSILSGPGVISTSSVSGDGSKETIAAGGAIANETISLTGLGTVKVNWSHTVTLTNVTTVDETITIYSVASCDSGVYAADKSKTYLDDTNNTALDATTAAAVTSDSANAATKKYNETTYLKIFLADKYGAKVDETDAYAEATATNGAFVAFDAGTPATSTVVTTTSPADAVVAIKLPADTYKPVTTVVTIKFNGTVVATRTVTFTGSPAKIVVSDLSKYIGATSTDTVNYTVLDSAGNQLGGWTPVAGDSTLNTNGASATTFAASSATATAAVVITAGAAEGASSTTFRIKLDDGTYVVSDPLSFSTTTKVMDKFTVKTDKATYNPGEVVTLTVTGVNAKGNPVADETSLGTVTWVGSGLTKVTADPTTADKSADGVWTYKFYASTTEGSYGYSLTSNAATNTTSAQTGTFVVKSGAVSNTEVLSAIVKLIASINKQIAALQKLILKKK